MKSELKKPQMFYTSPDWINRREFALGDWPNNRKTSGDKSRKASGSTAKGLAGIRKLERMGLL